MLFEGKGMPAKSAAAEDSEDAEFDYAFSGGKREVSCWGEVLLGTKTRLCPGMHTVPAVRLQQTLCM